MKKKKKDRIQDIIDEVNPSSQPAPDKLYVLFHPEHGIQKTSINTNTLEHWMRYETDDENVKGSRIITYIKSSLVQKTFRTRKKNR